MIQPSVISLFSGAGGLDYGFEAAGFRTRVAVERDHDCCQTLTRSRRWPVLEGDIAGIQTRHMLERGGLRRRDVDVVIGGPPCQPFSKAALWAERGSRGLADPRSDTLVQFLRVVEDTVPRAFVLENVQGLAAQGSESGLRFLLREIERINRETKSRYRPGLGVMVNAAGYGVPQLRERFFLVAARDGTPFEMPAPTHAPAEKKELDLFERNDLEPYRTAWDAIGGVVPDADEDLTVRGEWGALLPSIPEGSNYLWHTERGGGRPLFGWRCRYWSFLLKLAKNRPSWTIQAKPGPAVGPFHWSNRRLSRVELWKLQTFPDNIDFIGGRTSLQSQIGNAVPSLLGEVIGRAVREQLLRLPALRKPLKLLPPARNDVEGPERRHPVPKRYLSREGEHAAHPGVGRGVGARHRPHQFSL